MISCIKKVGGKKLFLKAVVNSRYQDRYLKKLTAVTLEIFYHAIFCLHRLVMVR